MTRYNCVGVSILRSSEDQGAMSFARSHVIILHIPRLAAIAFHRRQRLIAVIDAPNFAATMPVELRIT